MKVGLVFADGQGSEFEATLKDITDGIAKGYFHFVSHGRNFLIPLAGVRYVMYDNEAVTTRGFQNK